MPEKTIRSPQSAGHEECDPNFLKCRSSYKSKTKKKYYISSKKYKKKKKLMKITNI